MLAVAACLLRTPGAQTGPAVAAEGPPTRPARPLFNRGMALFRTPKRLELEPDRARVQRAQHAVGRQVARAALGTRLGGSEKAQERGGAPGHSQGGKIARRRHFGGFEGYFSSRRWAARPVVWE